MRRLGIVLTVMVSAGALSGNLAPRGPGSVSAAPRDGSARVEAASDTFIAIGIDEPQGHLNMLILGQKNEGNYFTYVKFNLPRDRIGEGATITRAVMRLSKLEPCEVDDPGPVKLEVRMLSRAFVENRTTMDTQPNSTGPNIFIEVPDPELRGYFDIDILPIVNKWYSGNATNYGVEVSPNFEGQDRTCVVRSREVGHYPLHEPPLLELAWTGGVTPSPTPSFTVTPSVTPTPSITPTPSLTPTASNTPDITDTPTATATPTVMPMFLPVNLNREDVRSPSTKEPTVEATEEPTVEGTKEPTVEGTEEPTVEATDELTPSASDTPDVTDTPTVTATPAPLAPTRDAAPGKGFWSRLLGFLSL